MRRQCLNVDVRLRQGRVHNAGFCVAVCAAGRTLLVPPGSRRRKQRRSIVITFGIHPLDPYTISEARGDQAAVTSTRQSQMITETSSRK